MSKGKHPHGVSGGVQVPSFFLQSSHCKSHALHSAQTVESHVVHGLTSLHPQSQPLKVIKHPKSHGGGVSGGVQVPAFVLQSSHCKSQALHSTQIAESHVVHGLTSLHPQSHPLPVIQHPKSQSSPLSGGNGGGVVVPTPFVIVKSG